MHKSNLTLHWIKCHYKFLCTIKYIKLRKGEASRIVSKNGLNNE